MIYYLTAIIIAINFLFSAPLSVHAAEETTEETTAWQYSEYTRYTLQDALDGNAEAEEQLRSVGVTFGQAVDASVRTLVIAPVKAVASSFVATSEDMIDTVVDTLIGDSNFMSEIFINPYSKSFEWGPGAGRHGGGEGSALSDLFHNTVYDNVPPGFYPCSWEAPLRYASWLPNRWCWYTSGFECYYTHIGGGRMVICSLFSDVNNITVHIREKDTGKPNSNTDGSESQSFTLGKNFPYNNKNYRYTVSAFFQSAPSDWLPPVVYGSEAAACEAFYGYTPSSQEVPNGKGYIRPINININASGDNVYNRNWDNVITTNFNDFGPDFETTIVNNFYYNQPSTDTPKYWYDPYPVEPGPTMEGTYGDLENVTFSDPNLQTDNMFVSDLFSALPVAVSGFIVSLILLSVVVLFLRG